MRQSKIRIHVSSGHSRENHPSCRLLPTGGSRKTFSDVYLFISFRGSPLALLSPKTAQISRHKSRTFLLENEWADLYCHFSCSCPFFSLSTCFFFSSFLILLLNMWVKPKHLPPAMFPTVATQGIPVSPVLPKSPPWWQSLLRPHVHLSTSSLVSIKHKVQWWGLKRHE